jgi:hypothetical protein
MKVTIYNNFYTPVEDKDFFASTRAETSLGLQQFLTHLNTIRYAN